MVPSGRTHTHRFLLMKSAWPSPATELATHKFTFAKFRNLSLDLQRRRQRFARQHLHPVRGVVHYGSNHRSGFHQIALLCVVVHIHVRVMRDTPVFYAVLNELESWQTDLVERQVIRSSGVSNADGSNTQIVEGSQPGHENRPHGVIALQIHATDFAGSIIVVEITGKFGVHGLQLHSLRIGERLLDIRPRAVYSLLLAAP